MVATVAGNKGLSARRQQGVGIHGAWFPNAMVERPNPGTMKKINFLTSSVF